MLTHTDRRLLRLQLAGIMCGLSFLMAGPVLAQVPGWPVEADADPDVDTFTNLDEYFVGTDPLNYTRLSSLTDHQVLTLLQAKAFLYF